MPVRPAPLECEPLTRSYPGGKTLTLPLGEWPKLDAYKAKHLALNRGLEAWADALQQELRQMATYAGMIVYLRGFNNAKENLGQERIKPRNYLPHEVVELRAATGEKFKYYLGQFSDNRAAAEHIKKEMGGTNNGATTEQPATTTGNNRGDAGTTSEETGRPEATGVDSKGKRRIDIESFGLRFN